MNRDFGEKSKFEIRNPKIRRFAIRFNASSAGHPARKLNGGFGQTALSDFELRIRLRTDLSFGMVSNSPPSHAG